MGLCLPTTTTTALVFEGDSITFGYGVNAAERYSNLLGQNTLSNWNILNNAVSGTSSADLSGSGFPYLSNAARVSNAVAFASGSSVKALSLLIGTNDLNLTSDSAATIMARITTYINAFRSVGFSKFVLFTIPAEDVNASVISGYPNRVTHETRRLVLNDLIRQQVGGLVNGVVDIGAHPILGSTTYTTNPAWFSDGVHFTAASYNIVYNLAKPVFTSL